MEEVELHIQRPGRLHFGAVVADGHGLEARERHDAVNVVRDLPLAKVLGCEREGDRVGRAVGLLERAVCWEGKIAAPNSEANLVLVTVKFAAAIPRVVAGCELDDVVVFLARGIRLGPAPRDILVVLRRRMVTATCRWRSTTAGA